MVNAFKIYYEIIFHIFTLEIILSYNIIFQIFTQEIILYKIYNHASIFWCSEMFCFDRVTNSQYMM